MKGDPRLSQRAQKISPFRVVEVMEAAWELEAASGQSIVHLVAGEPDFGTPRAVVEAARRAAADGDVHYTPALGIPALREAISAYYADRLGCPVPSSRIVVTTGASAALLLAFAATVDPGDEVLVSDPGYPCNANLLSMFDAAPARVAVGPDVQYQPDVAAVEAQRTERTRGVLICTPSNPTGSVVPDDTLEGLIAWAASAGLACYLDEVYGELVYDRRPSTGLRFSEDIFAVGSFSKTFGMTGWRLGWLVCPEWALETVTRLTQNVYISPPTVSQVGGAAAFTDEVWAEVAERLIVLKKRRDLIVDGLRSIGFGVPLTPEGAFYVYADSSGLAADSTELVGRLLRDVGVAVAPGNDFGAYRAESHIRLSYAASMAQIEEALERMAKGLAST